jgi:hypothetical protein
MGHPATLLAKRTLVALATAIAGVSLLMPARISSEAFCEKLRLKPIRCVCGTVIDAAGDPVSDAKVTIFRGETELASVKTSSDGKFALEGLKDGNYELQFNDPPFLQFRFPIVLVKPTKEWHRRLWVNLILPYPDSCAGVRLVGDKLHQ